MKVEISEEGVVYCEGLLCPPKNVFECGFCQKNPDNGECPLSKLIEYANVRIAKAIVDEMKDELRVLINQAKKHGITDISE